MILKEFQKKVYGNGNQEQKEQYIKFQFLKIQMLIT